MGRREYKGAAPATTLSSGILASSTSFNVADGTGYPTGAVGPFFIAIDKGTALEEKILCTSRTGNAFSCPGGRGADDTVAVDHAAGAAVHHVHTKTDADEANAHVNATTAIHGKTSALASIADVETLTNKTMSGSSNTFSNIPQSAVTALVADLAAKVAKADVHDSWEAAFAIALAANWSGAFDTALGANWQGVFDTDLDATLDALFANGLGTNWSSALQTNLGSGWTGVLDGTMGSGWDSAFPNALSLAWAFALGADLATMRPVSVTEGTEIGLTSTSYSALSPVCGIAFVAPPSGQAKWTISGRLWSAQNTATQFMSGELRTGATIGSGSVVSGQGASDDAAIIGGPNVTSGGVSYGSASRVRLVTGLTAGSSYHVRNMCKTSANGSGTVGYREMLVEPVL